ncbi:MAG TPA: hypothetical protein VID93_10550, partial [Acidimicrobiales bacterium]
AGAALALAVSVLGIMAAPLIPLQALFGFTTGMASAIFWTRLQARILGLRPGQPGTTAAVVGYLAMPGALVPLVAAAAADHLGLGAALAVYVAVALLLTTVTALSGRVEPSADRTGPNRAPEVPEIEAPTARLR